MRRGHSFSRRIARALGRSPPMDLRRITHESEHSPSRPAGAGEHVDQKCPAQQLGPGVPLRSDLVRLVRLLLRTGRGRHHVAWVVAPRHDLIPLARRTRDLVRPESLASTQQLPARRPNHGHHQQRCRAGASSCRPRQKELDEHRDRRCRPARSRTNEHFADLRRARRERDRLSPRCPGPDQPAWLGCGAR